MKRNPDHEELLSELIDDSVARGPSADAVLGLLRAEKARRRRGFRLAGAVAGLALLALSTKLWLDAEPAPKFVPQLAQRIIPVPAAEPFAVKRVDDEEFLKLLAQQDQPVALVKLPNGERRLLMVAPQADDTPGRD